MAGATQMDDTFRNAHRYGNDMLRQCSHRHWECVYWRRGRSPIVRDSQIKSSAWNFGGTQRLVFTLCAELFLFSAKFLRWNFDLHRSAAFVIFSSSPIHPLTLTIIDAYLSSGREKNEQSDSICWARARSRWFFAFQNDANQSSDAHCSSAISNNVVGAERYTFSPVRNISNITNAPYYFQLINRINYDATVATQLFYKSPRTLSLVGNGNSVFLLSTRS